MTKHEGIRRFVIMMHHFEVIWVILRDLRTIFHRLPISILMCLPTIRHLVSLIYTAEFAGEFLIV